MADDSSPRKRSWLKDLALALAAKQCESQCESQLAYPPRTKHAIKNLLPRSPGHVVECAVPGNMLSLVEPAQAGVVAEAVDGVVHQVRRPERLLRCAPARPVEDRHVGGDRSVHRLDHQPPAVGA